VRKISYVIDVSLARKANKMERHAAQAKPMKWSL